MSAPGRGAMRASAAERNREPILSVLRHVLPAQGTALEIASGTGQHAGAFAAAFPDLTWQPSDADPAACDSIAAWRDSLNLENLRPPLQLDVTGPDWENGIATSTTAILCINMIHIAPWAACESLIRGAGNLLARDGVLYLYGPYRRGGAHTAPSNADFDVSLRARNPDWGVRDLEAVAAKADMAGLALDQVVAMPANNFSLIFRRFAGN